MEPTDAGLAGGDDGEAVDGDGDGEGPREGMSPVRLLPCSIGERQAADPTRCDCKLDAVPPGILTVKLDAAAADAAAAAASCTT
jgi:hypothetical protein